MKIVDRYLFWELVAPLAAWLTFLVLLLFVMQFLKGTDVLLGSAMTGTDLGKLALFLIPHFVMMALPVAFLLAILLGLGRLGEDRELTALAGLGVAPSQIVGVPLLLGLALGGAMTVLSFTAEPQGLSSARGLVNEIIKKNVVGDVKPGVFYEGLTQLVMYAERVDRKGGAWKNVLIHDERDPASPLLVMARSGSVQASGAQEVLKLDLAEGFVHRANRSRSDYSVISFERSEIAVWVDEPIIQKNTFRSPREELAPLELLRAAEEQNRRGEDGRPFLMAFHLKLSQVLTPFVFALVGAPLAMAAAKGGRVRGYLLTLFGYVLYYVLSRGFENLGTAGAMPIVVAAQLPNVLFGGLGIFLLWRTSQRGVTA